MARVPKSSGKRILSVPHKISEDEKLFPEQRLIRKLVPCPFRNIKKTYSGKGWLEATQKDKVMEDGRVRNYTIEDLEKTGYPWFEIIHSEFALKRFLRLATDISYGIKGFSVFKPFIFPLAIAMDKIFCKRNYGFLLIVEMRKIS